MRFQDLQIQTRREMPANARSVGHSWLIRAGFISAEGVPTRLGEAALARLQSDMESGSQRLYRSVVTLRTDAGEVITTHPAGDLDLLICSTCNYTATRDLARTRKVQPDPEPPLALERVATPDCATIGELAAFLGVPASRTAKALLYWRPTDMSLVFAVVRGDMQLSEPKLAAAVGQVRIATRDEILSAGAVPGYASPIGLRSALVVVDDMIPGSPNLVAGANEAGYHLRNVNYGRDFSAELQLDLALAGPGDPCPTCAGTLDGGRGVLLTGSASTFPENALLALAEAHHDERGLLFPIGLAAFDVHLLNIPSKNLDTAVAARDLGREIQAAGISVMVDDRDERAGVKFNDADLIGAPLRVTVGEKKLVNRMVELKSRSGNSLEDVPIDALAARLHSLTLSHP